MLKKLFPVAGRILFSSNCTGNSSNRINLIPYQYQSYGIYEPDYLDSLKPKYPQYERINFQMKGHDFPVLENYQKFLHNAAEYLDFDVSECFALPPHYTQIQRFKPVSAVVDSEYKLITYERNIQISDLDTPSCSLFIRIAQAALPEGVTLNVMEYSEEHEEQRYVPDKELLDLKAQLETMQPGAQAPSGTKKK